MIDPAKSAAALSRPGIDPRKFVDIGVVTAVDVTSDGVHVDVTTLEGLRETAAVAQPYAGPGYGLHLPVDLDLPVVLAIPDGRWNAGARVIGSIWDAGDPPPKDVTDHREDVVLVVKPGQSVRIIVSDGGDVSIEARGSGKIRLGGDSATSNVLTQGDGALFLKALAAAIGAQSGNPPGAAALSALKSALETIQWPTGSPTATAVPPLIP